MRAAAFLGLLLVGLVGVTLFAIDARRMANKNAEEAKRQAGLAAINQTKAEAGEAEARQSEARARDLTVDLLVESGADALGKGSNSTALVLFARAMALRAADPGGQSLQADADGPRWRAVMV